MAFFDSPKNRALWDKELENLDMERARRKEAGYKPVPVRTGLSMDGGVSSSLRSRDNPKVRRITLKELEDIERRAREAERGAPGLADPAHRMRRGAERSHGIPERQQAKAAAR